VQTHQQQEAKRTTDLKEEGGLENSKILIGVYELVMYLCVYELVMYPATRRFFTNPKKQPFTCWILATVIAS